MLKDKIKSFVTKLKVGIKKNFDKVAMCAMMPMGMIGNVKARLAETVAGVSDTDIDSMLESIKGLFSAFSVANLVKIIGAALALGVVLFLFWFAYRFIKRAVVKALKKGSI